MNLHFRKVRDLHKYDCLRANKSTMAWGVEARVPFLDRQAQKISMGARGVYIMLNTVVVGGYTVCPRCSYLFYIVNFKMGNYFLDK